MLASRRPGKDGRSGEDLPIHQKHGIAAVAEMRGHRPMSLSRQAKRQTAVSSQTPRAAPAGRKPGHSGFSVAFTLLKLIGSADKNVMWRERFIVLLSIWLAWRVDRHPRPARGATFGQVVAIGGQAADIALDEGRGVLYIANFTAGRIDVLSLSDNTIQHLDPRSGGAVLAGALPGRPVSWW